tara:strand:- start:9264 stop:10328 length:1065 start_codon:yes stop_codon:yes gene_type:complete
LKRSTAFFINGGAGRVICSIPAFEQYQKENPEDDFIIICEGGMDFFKGHPTLHTRAYDNWHKGLFEHFIKDRNCVTPEPYRVWEYYNQQCSLTEAFDICINNKGIRKLSAPKIYLNKMEIVNAANVIEEVKAVTGFDKIVVIQPFGRSTETIGDFIVDATSRSFQLNNIIEIINILKKEYGIIAMSELPLTIDDKDNTYPIAQPQIPDLRIWAGVIQIADHFVGCDSLGQHIVKALEKTATVVTGSTYPVNISYPNDKDFDIIDIGAGKRVYSPIRISIDEELDRLNDETMEMTNDQIMEVVNSVRKRLGKSTRSSSKPQSTPPGVEHLQNNTNKPLLVPGASSLPTVKPIGKK